MKYFLSIFICLLCLKQGIFPQSNAILSLPTPKEILGYDLGKHFTSHEGIEHFILSLRDRATDRMKVLPYGESCEHRQLYLVVISDSQNLQHLDTIKQHILQLTDPENISSTDAERIITTTPLVVWLSYGVHGNEASASEAAMNVIYHLVSDTDSATASLLRNVVVVVDPLLNPDGHERYVNFELTHAGSTPLADQNAVEHHEDWPSGRTNHYLFDLNRDWAWLTQPESQARIKAYREWMPQVHVDFHEMGHNSSYFFFPPFKPVNKNIPSATIAWDKIFGKANAEAFDKKGWSYWSGESFDLYYPGYGDSWPSLHGAIGMTYEQAGQAGVRIRRADETVLTLQDRMEHHSTTSFATLRTASGHHVQLLREFYLFFKEAVQEGKNGSVKEFIVDPTKDPVLAAKMVSLLMNQGIEVGQTTENFSCNDLQTYFSKGIISKSFPAGSYIIKLDQPAKHFILALMEQEPVLTDTFFYDISTWSLPLAYGVDTYWSEKKLSIPIDKISSTVIPDGSVVGKKASYAYLFKWNSNSAARALAWLLQHNYKVNVAMKEFVLDNEIFPRGTIVVPVTGNSSDLEHDIRELATKTHLTIHSANSGLTQSGIDLGSDRVVRLKQPNIIVVTQSPVSPESFGEIWSLFDSMYDIEFVPMKLDQLRQVDLHDYTAIIFPDDNDGGHGYKDHIDSAFVQKLKQWIGNGGTFIGIEGGAAFASASIGKISGIKIKEKKKIDQDIKKDSSMNARLSEEELEKRSTVEEKEHKRRLESFPGTILHVRLDTSHPLGFGYDRDIAVFKTDKTVYELSEHGYNVGLYAKSPRVSGYLSKENEHNIEDTPFLVHEQLGSGNIILFADDPNFRLFWDGLNKVFLNSILLMPSIHNVMLTSEGE
jgi:hypothetical protein